MTNYNWGWYKDVEGLYHEGEEGIAKYSIFSYWYAIEVLKGRFRAGEKEIKSNETNWNNYVRFLENKGIEI